MATTNVQIAEAKVSKCERPLISVLSLGGGVITLFTISFADLKYASYNIGIFICTTCAAIHRGIGAHKSKVKHLKLDRFEDSQIERLQEIGNIAAKLKYEERVPPCYRRPKENDPQ